MLVVLVKVTQNRVKNKNCHLMEMGDGIHLFQIYKHIALLIIYTRSRERNAESEKLT